MMIHKVTRELRRRLDAAGIAWCDDSEEFHCGEPAHYVYHMERTKVRDAEGFEEASMIWGYSGPAGSKTGSTYGWPDKVEVMIPYLGTCEPEPMSVDDAVAFLIKKGALSKIKAETSSSAIALRPDTGKARLETAIGSPGEELVRCRECVNWGSFPQGWPDDYCPVVRKCTRSDDWC